MVTAGEHLRPPPTLSAAHTPFLATSQLTSEQAFAIPKWRPRNGLDEHHPLWKAGIRRLLAAYDLSEAELVEGVTQCRNVLTGAVPVTFSHDSVEALAQAAQLDSAVEQWRAINTAVFWHVLSSVDMVSSYSLTDMRYIEDLYCKRLADGVELLRYLHKFADTDDGRVQRQLKRSIGRPLGSPLTRARLHHHAEQTFQRWQLIKGNDPTRLSSLVEYWSELRDTLPNNAGSTAAELLLASWLSDQTVVPKGATMEQSHYSTPFRAYDSGIDALIEHARTLGIPSGEAVARSALVFLGPDGQLMLGEDCPACDDADSLSLNAIGGGAPPPTRGNKCKFCPAFNCQSELQGGPSACMCRWDSTHTLADLTPGAKGYVHMARQWHEANKSATTLKGVEFTVRPTGGAERQRGPRRTGRPAIAPDASNTGPGAGRFTGTPGGARPPGSLAIISEGDESLAEEEGESTLEELDSIPAGGALASTTIGGVSAITTSLKELLGDTEGESNDFEAWLQEHDECSPGIMALECGLDDELIIEGTQHQLFPMFTRSQTVEQAAQAERERIAEHVTQLVEAQREQLAERVTQMEATLADQVKVEHTVAQDVKAASALTKLESTPPAMKLASAPQPEPPLPNVMLSPTSSFKGELMKQSSTSSKMTSEEHLAAAALIQAKEKRQLMMPAKESLMHKVLARLRVYITSMSVHHWASLAVMWQFARPWVGPVIRHFVEALFTHLLNKLMGLGAHLPQWLKRIMLAACKLGASASTIIAALAAKRSNTAAATTTGSTIVATALPIMSTTVATFSDTIDVEQGSLMIIAQDGDKCTATQHIDRKCTTAQHEMDKSADVQLTDVAHTFTDAINFEHGTLAMLTQAGGKRTASQSRVDALEEMPPIEDDANPYESTKAVLVAAVQAIKAWMGDREVGAISPGTWKSAWTSEGVADTLTMLAPHMGVYRVQKGTLNAIGTALVRQIWPAHFASVKDACTLLNSGKGISNIRRHAATLTRILTRLGTHGSIGTAEETMIWIVASAADERSDMSLLLEASMQVERAGMVEESCEEHIGAIVGTTGNPDKPVILRLALSHAGRLLALCDDAQCVHHTDDHSTISTASDNEDEERWLQATAREVLADEDTLNSIIAGLCPMCGLWLTGTVRCLCNQAPWIRPEGYDSGEELNNFYSQESDEDIDQHEALHATPPPTPRPTMDQLMEDVESTIYDDVEFRDYTVSPDAPETPGSLCFITRGLTAADGQLFQSHMNSDLMDTKALCMISASQPKPTQANPMHNCVSDATVESTESGAGPEAPIPQPASNVAADAPVKALMLVLPAKDKDALAGFVPILMDNGASWEVHCSRTLDGAVIDSYQPNEAELTVGKKGSGLSSKGSYLYVIDWYGSDGTGERIVERMMHTPDLPFRAVASEPTLVYGRKYKFTMTHHEGRVMQNADGHVMPLWMSKQKLGWMKARFVTDPQQQRDAIAAMKPMHQLTIIGKGELRSAGVPTTTVWSGSLRGVDLLRHEHVVSGHLSLRKLLILLKAKGLPEGYITKKDVEEFIRQSCGICESTKMRRRPFSLKIPPLDTTVPLPGKVWILDELVLEVPSAYHGFTVIAVAVDRNTDMVWIRPQLTQDSDDVNMTHAMLKAFVLPTHGEIHIIRKDSLPSHKSVSHKKALADLGVHGQLSPPGVHEGVHKAENLLQHCTPVAAAFLLGSPDLGENHFTSAFATAVACRIYGPVGTDVPPRSPIMKYYKKHEWIDSPLYVYGSAAKWGKHPEFRGGHADTRSTACCYTGPPFESNSHVHCSVWAGDRYLDVDVGYLNVDDRLIVQRSLRTDPSHQPFGQLGGPPKIVLDTAVWYNPQTDLHPAEQAARTAAADGGALDAPLPSFAGSVWLSHSPVPTTSFTVGVGSGKPRPGDCTSWLDLHSNGTHLQIRIDEHVGGYEHRYDRPTVFAGLMMLLGHERCDGAFLQPRCGPWSAAHYAPGKLPPVFCIGFEDGVLDASGKVVPRAQEAMADARLHAQMGRRVLSRNKLLLVEQPIGQGRHSLVPARGLEEHTTLYDTSPFTELRLEFKLEDVFTDLAMSGHDKRKTTHFVADSILAMPLREQLGTLRIPKGWISSTPPLQGTDSDGNYRTSYSEVYMPLTCERLSLSWWGALLLLRAAEGGADDSSQQTTAEHGAQSKESNEPNHTASAKHGTTPVEHEIGTRVETFWHKDKTWFAGTVTGLGTSNTTIKGRRMSVPDITIAYDDGETLTHMLHANAVRKEGGVLHILSTEDEGFMYCRELTDPDDQPTLSALLNEREKHHESMSALHNATQAMYAAHEEGYADACMEAPRLMSVMESRVKDSLERQAVDTDAVDVDLQTGVHSHTGEAMMITSLEFDIEDNVLLNKSALFVVSSDGTLLKARSLDNAHARYWHTPTNEREYRMSPQRDYWRTAKELKWDKYLALDMFTWVPVSSINQKVDRIYSTLWAYKIKFEEGLKFSKLNPRWCLKGGTMDRSKFKAHAETLRMSTYRTILACKGGYWHAFCEFLLDCSDAFQSTRTDDVPLKEQVRLFCWPAPGFEQVSPQGERMACKVNVAMQGRIDATLLFNTKLFDLLVLKAGLTRLMWDKQVAIYHVGPLTNTAASLSEVLLAIKSAKDTPIGEPPIGYAMLGWHVDDALGLACSVGWTRDRNTHRVIQYIKGTIEVLYATTLTGWHGNKSLGFLLTVDEDNERVTMSARDTLEQLEKDLLKDVVRISPKHAWSAEFYDIPAGEIPNEGDPDRSRVLNNMAMGRHALGTFIWTNQAHMEGMTGNNVLCSNMQYPHDRTLKCARYLLMHMLAHSKGVSFGLKGHFGLEQPEGIDLSSPYTGTKFMFFHFFADANLRVSSTTGGIGMLGGGCILPVCQRQQLSAPGSHTVEVVGAGTNFSLLVPCNGVLQELRIRQGMSTPLYLDSSTTVFVATSDTAIKKSIWLIRRVAVLEDGVTHGEIQPLHLTERDMAADPMTKYLTHGVWSRHMHYILNKMGPLPPYPSKRELSNE